MSDLGPISNVSLSTSEVLLRRLKVAAAGRLSAQLLHDARIETALDVMTDQMIVQLSTHVLAHRRGQKNEQVPFTTTVDVGGTIPVRAPDDDVPGAVVLVLAGVAGLASGIAGSIVGLIVAAAFAVLAVWLMVRHLPDREVDWERRVSVSGHVVVDGTAYDTYPENSVVLPSEYGSPHRVVMFTADPYLSAEGGDGGAA